MRMFDEITVSVGLGQPAKESLAATGMKRDLLLRQGHWLLTKYFPGNPINLSQRVTELRFQDKVAESLRVSMKNIGRLDELTNEISQYSTEEDIAKWIRNIENQARKVMEGENPEAVRDFRKKMNDAKQEILDGREYGDLSKLDKAYYKIIKASEKLKSAGLDVAVSNALDKKALSNAFRIAHTEIRKAYNVGVYTRGMQDEDVEAFKIDLSAAGNNCDECTEIAEMDNGAGPGIFPVDEVPAIPQHPHCRCELTPVYSLPKGITAEDIETEYDGELMQKLPEDLT